MNISNERVSSLAVGTAWLGGFKVERKFYATIKDLDRKQRLLKFWINALKSIFEDSKVVIDLAQMYGSGFTDIAVGEVIKDFERNDLFLVWKSDIQDFADLRLCVENALYSLGVDSVDLLMPHKKVDPSLLSNAIAAMKDLQGKGLIKYYGFGHATRQMLEQAEEIEPQPAVCSTTKAIQNSASIHVGLKYIPNGLIEYCKARNITIMAYSPVGRVIKDGVALERIERVRDINDYGHCTNAQIATAWSLNKGFLPICGSQNREHIKELLESTKIGLSQYAMEILDGN